MLGTGDHHGRAHLFPHNGRTSFEDSVIAVEPRVVLVDSQFQARLRSSTKDISSRDQDGVVNSATLPAYCLGRLIDGTRLHTTATDSASKIKYMSKGEIRSSINKIYSNSRGKT